MVFDDFPPMMPGDDHIEKEEVENPCFSPKCFTAAVIVLSRHLSDRKYAATKASKMVFLKHLGGNHCDLALLTLLQKSREGYGSNGAIV